MKRNKLTLTKFLNLSKEEQYQAAFNRGVFIEKIIRSNRIYSLYAVDMFFVEFEYDGMDNSIIGKHAFTAGVKLDDYVPVDVNKLLWN